MEENKPKEVKAVLKTPATVKKHIAGGLRVNLREKPSFEANVLKVLNPGEEVIVYKEVEGDFFKVKTGGYIHSSLVQ